ncbi:MAG: hypothetical protein GY801_09310, partial [bacterium]|nr:hypothetical protein [bacterium]
VAEKFRDAEKAGIKARLNTLAQVDIATLQLCIACQLILDEKLPGKEVRQAIFQEIPREELEKAVALVNQETSIHAPLYYNLLTDGYRSIRLFLPTLLKTIVFKGTDASDDILKAWQFLYRLDHTRPRPNMETAPQAVVNGSAWRAVVYDQEKQVDRRYYTFCVLQSLIAALERRDIFIVPSHRWQDLRTQLLQGEAWKKARPQICTALGKTADGEKEVKKLTKRLDSLYRQVAKRLANNKSISIKKEGDHERILLTPLKKIPDGKRLKQLRAAVSQLMPELDLPDLLLEVHQLTGFADEF